MKTKITLFVLFLCSTLFFAQKLKLISENSGQPLANVSVFSQDGKVLATSDLDGFIEKESLQPLQLEYKLIYDDYQIGTLLQNQVAFDIIKLKDRVADIKTVTINKKGSKYAVLTGNFVGYITVNQKTTAFVEGIVSYVFDNKTRKLKGTNVNQSRLFFTPNEEEENRKITNKDNYVGFLQLPNLKDVENLAKYKDHSRYKFKQSKLADKTQQELFSSAFTEKEFSLFGYRIFKWTYLNHFDFEKDTKNTLRDLKYANQIMVLNLKHKSEPEYTNVKIYTNLYPTDLSYTDENISTKNSLDRNKSNYSTKFWESADFPNMRNVFESIFGSGMKEAPNAFKN